MNINTLCTYTTRPAVFQKGTAVMWTDPYISSQLLKHHIDPDTDIASRSDAKITLLVDWMLARRPLSQMHILDLGCGPGLYAEKLASHGHTVTGVDFSERSIAYAERITKERGSHISYVCDDYLNITYEHTFDMAIMIYLDFCVLTPEEQTTLLRAVSRALRPGGVFIFDVVNGKHIDEKILRPSWEVSQKGFWRDGPYIALNNGYHYPEHKAFVNQHIIIDQDEHVDTYLFWTSYFSYEDLAPRLRSAGFTQIDAYDDVLPAGDTWNGDNVSYYVAAVP